MANKKVIVTNDHGIHARVAMRVVEKTKNLSSHVTICNKCRKADGCSILQLLMLEAEKGAEIELVVTGIDEERGLREIADIFAQGSGI